MSLITVIDAIDSALPFNPTFHKICTLQTRDEKTFPMRNIGNGEGEQISWDDTYKLQIYHRILDVENESDPNQGIGNKPFEFRLYTMRLVGIGTRELLTVANYEDNDQICNTVSDAIPRFINARNYVQVIDHEVDKLAVYESEFNGATEFNSKTLDGVAFWIEYTIKMKVC